MKVLSVRMSLLGLLSLTLVPAHAQTPLRSTKEAFDKMEVRIPMRDGKTLFTSIYVPKDKSHPWPFLMQRTPYSCGPYGIDQYKGALGPESGFTNENYIFVYQDVRGRYMSEGDFHWMNPYIPNKKPGEVDESTDTWDTIDWLLKNVANNNGKVGVYGTSFPGHYAAQCLINPHPALKAASPQAPMDDNWMGDDMHHNGAFYWPHGMNFMSGFGVPRTGPTTQYGPGAFRYDTPDGYQKLLEVGTPGNSLEKLNMKMIPMWKTWLEHPDYDSYWKPQQVSQHLKKADKVAVLLVGGWFDAEDLQGPLRIYRRIQEFTPNNNTKLVMGPWYHGTWNGGPGDSLWDISWKTKAGEVFRNDIQRPFFQTYLMDGTGAENISKMTAFDTGTGEFRHFDSWPPKGVKPVVLSFSKGRLSLGSQVSNQPLQTVSWVSDPMHPVPVSNTISTGMPREYMIEDQRFAMKRPDVVTFKSDPLTHEQTLLGAVKVHLKVATTGTDSDFIVKLIDVFPDSASVRSARTPGGSPMGGYQMMLRGEPFRARYRTSFSKSVPMPSGKFVDIDFAMPDICHTFLPGHRIMVQIQSSWFPVVDRNPQTFVKNMFFAKDSDFKVATQSVRLGGKDGTRIVLSGL